jgi:hypothetical protein
MAADPADFALDHLEEAESFHASEKTGGGNGENGFGDDGFDHQPGDGLEFGGGDGGELFIAADEAFEAGFVEIVGPGGGVVGAAEDGELEGAVGEIDDALLETCGIVVDDGDDFAFVEEDIAGVPVAVDDLGGPVVETGGIDFFVGRGVGVAEVAEGGAEFVGVGVVGALEALEGGGDLVDGGEDGGGVVVGAFGNFELGFVIFDEGVVAGKDAAGVEGGFEGVVVGVAVEVFEKFVDVAVVLDHGVVVFAGADEVGEGEVFGGEEVLEGVGEGDFEGVVFALGAAFEEELAALAGDEEFGGLAGAARVVLDGGDVADVEMAEDDGQFVGGEFFAVAHGGEDNGESVKGEKSKSVKWVGRGWG